MRRLFLLIALAACDESEPAPPEPPWQVRAELPEGRRRLEASATANGSRLVVVGGFEDETLAISRTILQYDPFRDAWTVSPHDAPAAVTHAALASVGGSLYLLGGLEGSSFVPTGKAFRLRPFEQQRWLQPPGESTAWEPLADLPAGHERGAAAVVVSEGHIFLLGGETAAGFTDTILDYEITSNTWTVLDARLTTPRSHAAAMRDEEGTFIVAGGNGLLGPLGDTAALRIGATTWEPREPMPTPRGGCAYGVLYGQLVCAGGEIGTEVSRAVEVYDPTQNIWTAKPEMLEARAGAPGAIVASRLYVVGGSQTNAFTPTGTVFEFDLLDTLPR